MLQSQRRFRRGVWRSSWAVVGGAAVLALPTSIPLAATVILTGIGAVSYSVHRRVGDRDWENGSTRMSSPDSDEADRNSAERTEKQVGSFEFESQPEAPESPDQGVDGERSLTVRSDNRSSRSTLIVLKSSKRSLTH